MAHVARLFNDGKAAAKVEARTKREIGRAKV